jgi:biotin carboxylase
VIIGASSEALHTIEKAREQGLWITALDGNPQAEGLGAADEARVVDISDENAVLCALQEIRPDFVLTVPIGRYLTTIGAVNDVLGLPGISREMASLCTDKYRFHSRLSGQGLRPCHCYAGKEGEKEASALTDRILSGELPLHFPAIVKPRFGSGSRGIHVVSCQKELREALQAASGEEYVLEEWVEGEEYGVDGAVIQGSFQMVLLRYKKNTPMPARQAVAYFSVLPEETFYGQVLEYMKQVTAALGLDECLLHADIIRSKEGPFAIEVSARPSGHNLHNLFTPLCTGVDMAEEYMKHRLGRACCFVPVQTKSMMIHYFDMEGKVRQVPDRETAASVLAEETKLVRWECHIREGERLAAVSDGHSLMGRGYFILEGQKKEKLLEAAEHIKSLFF